MRVLKTLFFSLIGLALAAGVAFVVGREVWLQLGLSEVKSAVTQMKTVTRQTGLYIQNCRAKGPISGSENPIETIQLRFTSPRDFQVEVVCTQFRLSPLVVKTYTLPRYVVKTPGSTGIIWQEKTVGGVELELWGRQRAVVVDDRRFIGGALPPPTERLEPLTTCAGYGYECCVEQITQGVGELVPSVLDCPRSCYAGCQTRPVVLAFTSQPYYDEQTREVIIGNGEVVELRYVIEDLARRGVTVTLEFGDGVSEIFSETMGGTSHTYRCASGECRYQARVVASDGSGVSAAQTPISQITVVVR